jgi:hypothetical protein
MSLYQVAEEIARRLGGIFRKDRTGRRPVYGGNRTFQEDPPWRDCLLFFESFLGDNARIMHLFAKLTPERALASGKRSYFEARAGAEVAGSPAGR